MTEPRRMIFGAFVAGIAAVAASYVLAFLPGDAPSTASWLMVVGTAVSLSAMLALGAYRPGINGLRIGLLVAFLLLVMVGGFGLGLLLPAETVDSQLVLGLPRRAAILLLGIGLLPIAVLPFAYARDFADRGLDEAALKHLRDECLRLQDEHGIRRGGGH